MSIKYLLVGSGGREHAIAACLANSDETDHVFVAPGNGGTECDHPKVSNLQIKSDDLTGLVKFADEKKIDITMVGPEIPLANGIVDLFEEQGLKCFGPKKAAARLESSKAFAKAFMERWSIPTARGGSFTDYPAALDYLRSFGSVPVLKASGLAAGKGVVLPDTLEDAETTLQEMMVHGRFGDSGACVVIEERLVGYEISLLAVCDGANLVTLPAARDHKRLLDGDQGPNTGGMGAVAPVLSPSSDLHRQLTAILQAVLDGMAAEGMPYTGILYGGFMITHAGPKVLEFNCRFGDPETQAVLPLLPKNALNDYVAAALNKTLDRCRPIAPTTHSATIVMASGGYPNEYQRGIPINGLSVVNAMTDVNVFHAGTILKDGQHVTSGGRVLAVTGLGKTPNDALERAKKAAANIEFAGQHFRTDIGQTLR